MAPGWMAHCSYQERMSRIDVDLQATHRPLRTWRANVTLRRCWRCLACSAKITHGRQAATPPPPGCRSSGMSVWACALREARVLPTTFERTESAGLPRPIPPRARASASGAPPTASLCISGAVGKGAPSAHFASSACSWSCGRPPPPPPRPRVDVPTPTTRKPRPDAKRRTPDSCPRALRRRSGDTVCCEGMALPTRGAERRRGPDLRETRASLHAGSFHKGAEHVRKGSCGEPRPGSVKTGATGARECAARRVHSHPECGFAGVWRAMRCARLTSAHSARARRSQSTLQCAKRSDRLRHRSRTTLYAERKVAVLVTSHVSNMCVCVSHARRASCMRAARGRHLSGLRGACKRRRLATSIKE